MKPRILVVGDVMLDRYLHGVVERLNPEAPGVVFKVERVENRLGGAGALAYLCAGLGCETVLLSGIGMDDAGSEIKWLCDDHGIFRARCVSLNKTTVKERRVANGRLLNDRIDFDYDAPKRLKEDVSGEMRVLNRKYNCILVADYGRGVVRQGLTEELRRRFTETPILVDPDRDTDWLERYEGATIIKANRAEAKSRMLPSRCRLIVTLGEEGMKLDGKLIPTRAIRSLDVTGAGDTVLAVIGWSIARGIPLEKACELANRAAGLQVQRLGVQQILPEEIEPAERPCGAIAFAAAQRAAGKTIVFANGCFDVLHAGHVATLRYAKSLGDVLIVGLNSDQSVRALKGQGRPIHSQQHRAQVLEALACVDRVAIFDGEPTELLSAIRPDVLVKGEDYRDLPISGSQFAERVEFAPLVAGLSTSHAIEAATQR